MNAAAESVQARAVGYLKAHWHHVTLALIVGLALFFRLYGINWDQGGLFHPDERAILFHVTDLSFPTGDLDSLFSADSSLNPGWFPYGSFPLYLLKLTGYLAPPFLEDPSFTKLAIMGRATSAIFDVVTIAFIYLVGARLFGKVAGLLGASLIALSVLHIQQSHFFVTDIMLATFLIVSFFFLTRAMDRGTLKSFGLAALFFGLALATKASAAPFALAFVAAGLLYANRAGPDGTAPPGRVRQGAKGLVMAGAVTLVVLFIAQPYAFIDWGTFWGDVGEQSEMVRRIRDYPYTRQYVDTTPYLYQVKQLTVWGAGIPAGILLWAGLGFSLVATVWKRSRAHALMLSFVVPYFLLTGSFEVKFLRYLLPITPFLAIMAASLITWSVGWLKQRRWRLGRPQLLYGLFGLVMIVSLLYSVAYVRVYNRPHPATAASEWIRANAEPGATIVKEHWEEGLPNLGGFRVHGLELELYNDDTTAKRAHMVQRLTEADYLVFYSNRLYATIPRLPERYPMTSRYYEQLFAGELGFDLVHWESSYPNLFGVSLVDDSFARVDTPPPEALRDYEQTTRSWNLGWADESFTVYDHPLVLVFEKRLEGSEAEQRAFFFATLPQAPSGQRDPTTGFGLLLTPEEAQVQQAGGTWSELFQRGSFVNTVPALFWFLAAQVAFLIALPITLVVFRWLPDRGYLLGKMLGILLLAYIPWLLASLHWLDYSRLSIILGMLLIAAVSGAIFWRKRDEILTFLKENRRLIITGELVFLAAFLALYGLHIWNPDLWHPFRGGEKPMDFAYFNAVVRSTQMPPYDPWFSGGYLNYYYFGQFMNATLTKLTGIMPSIAINLTVPLFFALMAGGVFSLVYNLVVLSKRRLSAAAGLVSRFSSPVLIALLGAALVLVIGNMNGAAQLFQGAERSFSGEPFRSFDFWQSSRMMPPDPPGFEVTEFPFFTFLFADPHAHLFAMPLTMLALGLALSIVLGSRTRLGVLGKTAVLPIVVLALTLGAILATNSWDVVTYATVGAVAIVIAELGVRRRLSRSFFAASAAKVALLAGLSLLFFLPYIASYEPPIHDPAPIAVSSVPLLGSAVDLIRGTFFQSETTTVLWRYVAIHAPFLMIIASYLAFRLWRVYGSGLQAALAEARGRGVPARLELLVGRLGVWRITYVALGLVFLVSLSSTGYATVGFLTALLMLVLPLVLREVMDRKEGFPVRLFFLGIIAAPLALGIFVDLMTFRNDIGRLNTVFKFYLQAWTLFGIASAYALWRLRFGQVFTTKAFRLVWQGALVVVLASVLIYPLMGTLDRMRDRFNALPPSNDGMTYMDVAQYQDVEGEAPLELVWDRLGIEWLQDNVKGSPVIVEGLSDLYRWSGRVSIYTGLPAVIGWDHHQRQQRHDYHWAVDQRRREVASFYRSDSIAAAEQFLDRYSVRYIYVGQMERQRYPSAGLAKFNAMVGSTLDIVYANEHVRIYEVLAQEKDSTALASTNLERVD